MGLTIHYDLHSDIPSSREARRLVEELRKKALNLPFAEVGEVIEVHGDACDFEKYDRDNPLRWLVSQAGGWFVKESIHYRVMPKQVIMFSTSPGEGCEDADFGLAIYPSILPIQDPRTGRNRRLQTELKGWCWSSFCKTIYASRHGIEHFVKCHLSVVAMLDHALRLQGRQQGPHRRIRRRVRQLVEHLLRRRPAAPVEDVHHLPFAPRMMSRIHARHAPTLPPRDKKSTSNAVFSAEKG